MNNPFETTKFDGRKSQATSVTCRLAMIGRFDAEQCRAAARLPGIQKTVRLALMGRIKRLDKQQGVTHDPD